MTTWRRSSYFTNDTCVEALRWRTSSYSSAGTCVEMAEVGDTIAVRNSNQTEAGMIRVPAAAWSALLAVAKAGDLD